MFLDVFRVLSIYNSSINLCITKMLENTLGKHATKMLYSRMLNEFKVV